MGLLNKWKKKLAIKPTSELTQADREDLTSLMTHPGYQVILNIMQQVCEVSETELIQLDPMIHNTMQIAAAQSTARAQRVFFERVQARFNYERNEALGTPQPQGNPDLDDPETIERLLDPTR